MRARFRLCPDLAVYWAAANESAAATTVNPATGATVSLEYYHADRPGSVIAKTGETGSVTAQYVYTPYGVERQPKRSPK